MVKDSGCICDARPKPGCDARPKAHLLNALKASMVLDTQEKCYAVIGEERSKIYKVGLGLIAEPSLFTFIVY